MASWKIELRDKTIVTREEATVSDFVGVAELLAGANWNQIDPTLGPRELATWVAVLEVNHGDGENISVEIEKIMRIPMVELIQRIEVS